MKNLLFTLIFCGLISISAKSQSIVTFYTNMGNFEVELFDSIVPITAGNFRTLVENEYYDGVRFHRIIADFVIQGGKGGPVSPITDEFDSTLSNIEKTISMANSGPNTGTSQFFINVKDNTFLDFDKAPFTSAHPVFGTVISGWDVVETIELVPVNNNDRPLDDVIMDSVRVTQYPLGIKRIQPEQMSSIVYPNPINSQSVLDVKGDISGRAAVSIYGQNGTLISNSSIQLLNRQGQIRLSDFGVESLPNGIYYISIITDSNTIRNRFIVME